MTRGEQKAITAGLSFPTQAFIGGHFRRAISGKTIDAINPASGAVPGSVAACGPGLVDPAVQKACDAFADGR